MSAGTNLKQLLEKYSLDEAYFLYHYLGKHMMQWEVVREEKKDRKEIKGNCGEENEREMFEVMRSTFFSGLERKISPKNLVDEIVINLLNMKKGEVVKTEDKKRLIMDQTFKACWKRYFVDCEWAELIEWMSLSGMNQEGPWDHFGQLQEAIRAQERGAPHQEGREEKLGDDGLSEEEVSKTMIELSKSLLTRFGLKGITIYGQNTEDGIRMILGNLEEGLQTLAKATGLPESSLGMSKLSIQLNVPLSTGTGLFDPDRETIALVASSGWKALAHEWFHAVDMLTMRSLQGSKNSLSQDIRDIKGRTSAISELEWLKSHENELSNNWSWLESLKSFNPRKIVEVAGKTMERIRTQDPQDSDLQVGGWINEGDEITMNRMMGGLFDRFYKERVRQGDQEKARGEFKEMIEKHLKKDTKQRMQEIKEDLEVFCKKYLNHLPKFHYNAFVMAEFVCRNARIEESFKNNTEKKASWFQKFAEIADPLLGEDWVGYSTSSLEMAARGFEGNCFGEISDQELRCLTDKPDQSMYWPVGMEAGRARGYYISFLHHCMEVLAHDNEIKMDRKELEFARLKWVQEYENRHGKILNQELRQKQDGENCEKSETTGSLSQIAIKLKNKRRNIGNDESNLKAKRLIQ